MNNNLVGDIAITSVSAPGQINVGEAVDLSLTITNVGTAPVVGGFASPVPFGPIIFNNLYLSADNKFDSTDRQIDGSTGFTAELPLNPGENATLDFSATFDNSEIGNLTGDQFLIFVTGDGEFRDVEGVSTENNVFAVPVNISTSSVIEGTPLNDSLLGGRGDDEIRGLAGNDTIRGLANNDKLFGGEGKDLVFGNLGNDLILGQGGNDTLSGDMGNDSLFGNTGNDRILGGKGDDFVRGGLGNDTIFGGQGNDELIGQDGNNFIGGGSGNDNVTGGSGADSLFGNVGDDYLFGSLDTDRLFGNAGNDTLLGGVGADTLVGGAGNDRLDGNADNDVYNGGAGSDTFVFRNTEGIDQVRDFEVGVDKIFIQLLNTGASNVDFDDLTLTQSGAGVRVAANGVNGVETLGVIQQTSVGELSANDFEIEAFDQNVFL